MTGLIEHQQGILHSQLVEKLQQVKQEHMNVYQHYAGVALEQQHIRQKHLVPETNTPHDVRIDTEQKRRTERGVRRGKKERKNPAGNTAGTPSGNLLDIIA